MQTNYNSSSTFCTANLITKRVADKHMTFRCIFWDFFKKCPKIRNDQNLQILKSIVTKRFFYEKSGDHKNFYGLTNIFFQHYFLKLKIGHYFCPKIKT